MLLDNLFISFDITGGRTILDLTLSSSFSFYRVRTLEWNKYLIPSFPIIRVVKTDIENEERIAKSTCFHTDISLLA